LDVVLEEVVSNINFFVKVTKKMGMFVIKTVSAKVVIVKIIIAHLVHKKISSNKKLAY
jgi:hypothetical protein